MKFFWTPILLILLSTSFSIFANNLDGISGVKVFRLKIKSEAGDVNCSGTMFRYKSNCHMVTNSHCFKRDSDKVEIFTASEPSKYPRNLEKWTVESGSFPFASTVMLHPTSPQCLGVRPWNRKHCDIRLYLYDSQSAPCPLHPAAEANGHTRGRVSAGICRCRWNHRPSHNFFSHPFWKPWLLDPVLRAFLKKW